MKHVNNLAANRKVFRAHAEIRSGEGFVRLQGVPEDAFADRRGIPGNRLLFRLNERPMAGRLRSTRSGAGEVLLDYLEVPPCRPVELDVEIDSLHRRRVFRLCAGAEYISSILMENDEVSAPPRVLFAADASSMLIEIRFSSAPPRYFATSLDRAVRSAVGSAEAQEDLFCGKKWNLFNPNFDLGARTISYYSLKYEQGRGLIQHINVNLENTWMYFFSGADRSAFLSACNARHYHEEQIAGSL